MESDELRTVRVYTKKYTSKDKDGNSVEKESQQKQVSLKKEDPFEDNDLVKVLLHRSKGFRKGTAGELERIFEK